MMRPTAEKVLRILFGHENFWSWDPQIDKLGRECLSYCKINSFQEKREIVNLFQFWLSKPDRTLHSFNI